MSLLKKCFVAGSIVVVLAAAAIAGGYHWATSPLDLTPAQLDVTVKPHSSLRSVTLQLNRGGVPVEPELFVIMTRLLGLQSDLKSATTSSRRASRRTRCCRKSRVATSTNTWRPSSKGGPSSVCVPSWTPIRRSSTTRRHERRRSDERDRAPEASIGNGEGLFFPDTYLFDKNTSDLDVYRRAYRLMRVRLDEAWTARAPNLPYKTPYDALTMASIIEKETGKKSDRPMVAAVFANRLRVGMPLQTDPTVIYGMGDSYTGPSGRKTCRPTLPTIPTPGWAFRQPPSRLPGSHRCRRR
jgi:conserved hypothetical protein, YceG family